MFLLLLIAGCIIFTTLKRAVPSAFIDLHCTHLYAMTTYVLYKL